MGVTRKERGTWCPDRQRKLFQLCNWRRIARYAVRKEEALRPTAELSYIRLSQIGDGGSDLHGSIHKTVAVIGKDHISTRITRRPVGIAGARQGAVIDDKGSGLESPDGIRSITEITDHVGILW